MMTRPRTTNEAERLTSLRALDILDTPEEEAFDDLTALAAFICQTPIALISLIDKDRQWFKSRVGWRATETPREVALCNHTIQQPGLFVVSDTAADQRFAENPLVTSDPGIRFYAGAPLLTPEGHGLGALCVIDHRPRELTPEQAQALCTLSHHVMMLFQLRRTNKALRESEEQFRGMFNQTIVGIAQVDLLGRFVRVNRRYCEIVGRGEAELYRLRMQDITHPNDLPQNLPLFEHLARGGLPFEIEKRYLRPDGSLVWVHNSVAALRDERGLPSSLFAVVLDVTRRKQAEEALRLARARLDLAVRGSNIGIWEVDMPDGVVQNGSVDVINFWEQLGYDRPESPSDFSKRMALVHPEDRVEVQRAMQAYLSGETPEFEVETRVQHKDGSYRWMLTRGVAVRDATGKPIRFLGSTIDITDRHQVEEALRVAKARLDLAIRASNIGIWELDMSKGDGAADPLTLMNCWEQLGYSQAESSYDHANPYHFVHADDREHVARATQAYLSGQTKEYETEYRLRHKDGSYRWTLARAVAERDQAGRPIRLTGSIVDITEIKRAEAALREAKELAEAANRAKDEFLANVSHEIRTPMNAILGMTELVLDTSLAEDQRQCLNTVKSAADNLLGILNDLLDFSKIEAGKLELDAAEFSLRTVLGETLHALAVRAHTKGLELVCHVQPNVPDALVGDAGRLRQVLLNLVGNAIKFTEKGEVVVRVSVAVDREPGHRSRFAEDGPVGPTAGPVMDCVSLSFEVSDTGIGIAPDKQEKIFRAFEQEDTSTTRKYGGTGLGLSIASRLAVLMGGKITVDSAPGQGSTFVFTARCGLQARPSEPVSVKPARLLRDLRVLIVDDNATNRRILMEWLNGWQMLPAAVSDGAAAMNALWQGVALGRPYALVLLDARMPDMDGLALVAIIRQRAELSGCRIILLTSGDRPGDLVRFQELQIDARLLKPVQQNELLETIYQVIGRTEGEASPAWEAAPTPVPASVPLHIVLAEDNEFNAQHLERLLVLRGHRVQLATNGREALTLAQQAVFDLLLLDIHMPQLDGFQVVQALREREQSTGGHLPVIALTARSRNEDRRQCLAAGMDDYLSKPIRAADLFAAIDRVVSVQGVGPGVPTNVGGRARLLDPVVLLAACGGVAKLLGEMCQNFKSAAPASLTEIRAAIRDRDAPRLHEAAHKLYGTITAFSTVAGQVVSDLEDCAVRGHLEEAQPLVTRLETMMQDVIQQVESLSLEALRRQVGGRQKE